MELKINAGNVSEEKKDTLALIQPFLLTGGSLKQDAQALHFPALV